MKKEQLVEVELGQEQTQWLREEKGENKIGIFLPKLLFLDQASCVSKKHQQFQCNWEM